MIEQYKSNTFSLLVQESKYALGIFNAINGTNYDNPSEIEITMLANGINLKVRNDASFIFHGSMNLYEHQSTPNPNMPIRFLMYITRLFEDYIKDEDIRKSPLVSLPTPHFVVLYNGLEDQPEVQTLRLSDAFQVKQEEYELELICKVYNINKTKNEWLVDNCEALKGYMTFVNKVRSIYVGRDLDKVKDALVEAIDYCIENSVLSDFFKKYRNQIMEVEMLDYSIERIENFAWKKGHAEGIELGREEGIELGSNLVQSVVTMILNGTDKKTILEREGVTEDTINKAESIIQSVRNSSGIQ